MPRVPFFIGRADELKQIRQRLFGANILDRIVVLQGPPGMGKTQLAAQYVTERGEDYSAIFWLDASSPSHLASSFADGRSNRSGKSLGHSYCECLQHVAPFETSL